MNGEKRIQRLAPSITAELKDFSSRIAVQKDVFPIRVGIDGFCASGKTTVSRVLSRYFTELGLKVIHASTDEFQNPPDIRWQLGQDSAEGFYRHAIDYDAIRRELLIPLGPGGTLRYRTSSYDIFNLRPNLSEQHTAPSHSILFLDGLFLHSTDLIECFDETIFVQAPFEACINRANVRNQERKNDAEEVEAVYRQRYIPGFELYIRERNPQELASLVVHNT